MPGPTRVIVNSLNEADSPTKFAKLNDKHAIHEAVVNEARSAGQKLAVPIHANGPPRRQCGANVIAQTVRCFKHHEFECCCTCASLFMHGEFEKHCRPV